ncbi:MAG: type II 3-dehydroquinate dehydratase [Peptostreptococcales bacterium]|jgi:3-dehydroquinate dehydratase-2
MKIQVIHGPNLNMLGIREKNIYGTMSLESINRLIGEAAEKLKIEVSIFQSNHEGSIIDKIHDCYNKYDGLVINPGAYTHYSYAIRDAIAAVSIPTVEVHLSDIQDREDFRKISVIKDVCVKQIAGKGYLSYIEGIEALLHRQEEN